LQFRRINFVDAVVDRVSALEPSAAAIGRLDPNAICPEPRQRLGISLVSAGGVKPAGGREILLAESIAIG
jgi:hypothetical protein